MQIGRAGLEDDAAGIALVEQQAHHVEGNEGVLVVGAIVGGVLDLGLEDADDLEDVAFDLDGFADGRIAVEELLRGVRPEDDDLAMLGEVGGLEVAALGDVQLAHGAVGVFDELAGDVDDLGAVFEAQAIIGLGADSGEEGNCLAHGLGVAVEELDALAGALSAGLHAGLPAPDHDDVVAQAEEAIQDLFAEAASVAQQKDYGDESPDDAEHGEPGAQAIAEQRLDALADDLTQVHGYSVLRHSMGLRLAARRAG